MDCVGIAGSVAGALVRDGETEFPRVDPLGVVGEATPFAETLVMIDGVFLPFGVTLDWSREDIFLGVSTFPFPFGSWFTGSCGSSVGDIAEGELCMGCCGDGGGKLPLSCGVGGGGSFSVSGYSSWTVCL